ncbi:MAG: PilN domain-containing protein [Deltaproteobacteria bacterium]|nr:PilN domain-containing protein [Deltaproteobacteria bacterium]
MALRDINLIPDEILERRSLIRHLLLWLSILVVVAALIMAARGYQNRMVYGETQNRQGAIKDLAAALTRTVGDIRKEQMALNLARREQVQLSALIEQRRSYSSVLAKLVDVMNDQTWLQQLAFNTTQDRTLHLSLMGFSHSHEALGTFIQRLSGEPMFRMVVLKSAQESADKLSGSAPVQFQIECDIAKEAP